MKTGIAKFYNRSKGYGFIVNDASHQTGLVNAISQNDKVEFVEEECKKALNAVKVKKMV